MNKFTKHMNEIGRKVFNSLVETEWPLKPVSIMWACDKCGSSIIQVLPNDPPAYCYSCGAGKEEWTE